MSDKPKYPLGDAMAVARDMVGLLTPHCLKIEIAGSIRRRKESVSDAELLFVPQFKTVPSKEDMWSSFEEDQVDSALQKMLGDSLAKRPNKNGQFAWGVKNKLAIHFASGIPIDFFATDEESWWNSLVVRTGGKDMNLQLTTSAQRLGRSLLAYGKGVRMPDGEIVSTHSEEEVFQLCGVEYLIPEERP